jgi:hypothetical protein
MRLGHTVIKGSSRGESSFASQEGPVSYEIIHASGKYITEKASLVEDHPLGTNGIDDDLMRKRLSAHVSELRPGLYAVAKDENVRVVVYDQNPNTGEEYSIELSSPVEIKELIPLDQRTSHALQTAYSGSGAGIVGFFGN